MLALQRVPGIGDRLTRQLISYCGSADQVFRTAKHKLTKIPGVGDICARAIHDGNTMSEAERELRRAERSNVAVITYLDKSYPQRMKFLDDAPVVLYVHGNTNLNAARVVAVVGTRNATPYGKQMVDHIIADLIPHGALVVSGLAYGIDIQAHKQALKHNLATIAVLGSGIDVIYPSSHKDTASKIVNQGALVTEKAFGTQPDGHNFPARNRIIAGLCDALIIVEAAERGGALITAEIANSYNRDVFAVPGNVGEIYSEGCNKLIKSNKANLLTGVKDLEYIMNWDTDVVSKANGKTLPLVFEMASLDPLEKCVVDQLNVKAGPLSIDDLTIACGLSPGPLASVLLNLEFRGVVSTLPGKRYRLNAR